MKTMRRTLGLILALAMALTVTAGAAFSDQSAIAHRQAVNACVTLHIIGGFPDGTYRPAGQLTRAQMCKMVAVAMNGGKEPALSPAAELSYKDTANHWARGYIEYCTAAGVVSGVGQGRFNPEGKVTGMQAAKMLLVVLGLDEGREGFTGSSWAANVSVRMTQLGLDKDIKMDPGQPLSRDNAAQMIWNALQANEQEYVSWQDFDDDGKEYLHLVLIDRYDEDTGLVITLLKDKYGMDTVPSI